MQMRGWRDVRAEAWELSQVAMVPARWAKDFMARFAEKKRRNHYDANVWLRDLSERMRAYRVPLNASDDEIRAIAKRQAFCTLDIARLHKFVDVSESRRLMGQYVQSWGLNAPDVVEDRPAIARMTCPDWWARQLRKVHARGLEGEAVRLGFVHRRAACYVSDDSLERRRQQKRRNAAMLDGLVAENDAGQRYTLAELAALSVANPAIRRGELMTRLAGFEFVASEVGHVAEFVTLTCPSQYHARGSASGEENQRYAGHTPRDAQKYLCQMWGRFRAACGRRKIGFYGFRIVEPHHDGCPHWHMVFFMPAGHVDVFRGLLSRYALAVDGDEPGARKNRVSFVSIDTKRGSACGYVSKYVSKNIDGFAVEEDLFGNPAVMAAARVEAWAATWGIRQFQQIGGPPVGVWRELRRVEKDDAARVGGVIEAAWCAAQKTDTHRADFGEYILINGGAICKKQDRPLGLVKTRAGERMNGENPEPAAPTRYGEVAGAAVYGVACGGVVVRSRRWVWRIGRGSIGGGWRLRPWSSLNNYTRERSEGSAMLGLIVGRKAQQNHDMGVGDGERRERKGVGQSGADAGFGFGEGGGVAADIPGTSAGRDTADTAGSRASGKGGRIGKRGA